MAGTQEYRDAANKKPKDRSSYEQGLVDDAHANGMTEIKNLDYAAKQTQKTYG